MRLKYFGINVFANISPLKGLTFYIHIHTHIKKKCRSHHSNLLDNENAFFKNYIFLPKVMDDWHKLKENNYFFPPEIKIK